MRKLEVLNTNYEKSGLYAKIPALNNMTLKEFFEGLNIVKNYDSVRTFNQAIETVDESILIDSSISLISGHKYFSAFDLLFKTMPADAPDSYRLWASSEGVTNTITHSFLTNEKEVFMNVKTSASSRTADLYLNLFGMTIGQSMSLETDLYFIIDLSNLSFEVTDEQVYYYYRMYRYLKDSKSFDGFTYLPSGQSKYDVAYVNKTIDEPIAELNGHTLREVFEDGNFYHGFEEVIGSVGTYYIYVGDIPQIYAGRNYYIRQSLKIISSDYNSGATGRVKFEVTNYIFQADYSTYNDGQYHTKSTIYSPLEDRSNQILFYGTSTVDNQNSIKDLMMIDLNEFGISLETDMDYYFDLYNKRKNITKIAMTYADIFEVFNDITNPNFENGFTGYTVAGDGINYTLHDGYIEFSAPGSNGYIKYDGFTRELINYYISSEFKSNGDASLSYYDGITTKKIDYSRINTWQHLSALFTNESITGSNYLLQLRDAYDGAATPTFNRNNIILSLKHFDELITKEQLDTMLAHYLLVKNIVIYPEIYVPVEPVGLGNRFKLLAVDDTVYGHELDFEDISFKMYFGVNFDAYKGYHAMMNMLKSNKAIIEYDWGIGPRYNDVRLLNAPKTEKDTSLLIISKFYFKRLNPFYELIEVSDEEDMKNESDLDSPVKLDLTVNDTTVSIKLLDASSGVQQEISFDFTGVSTPFNLTIDPETKKLLIDDITDAYDYADHTKDSFIYLPGDSEIYSINITGAAVNKITYKKWVIS